MSVQHLTPEQSSAYNKLQAFIQFRNKFSLVLSLVVLVCYYLFIITVGWFPEVLGYKVGPSVITLGIITGIATIVISIIVTGIYTFVANQYFDKDQAAIIKELQDTGTVDQIYQGQNS